MTSTLISLLLIFLIILSIALFMLYKKGKTLEEALEESEENNREMRLKYLPIINIDESIIIRENRANEITAKMIRLDLDRESKDAQFQIDYKRKRQTYESLLREISILEENVENISYGLYKPTYNFAASEQYKQRLEWVRNEEKQMIKDNKAAVCSTQWNVGGSRAQGEKMTNQYTKIMLRAFNGECDATIAKVKWNNMANMEARIEKAYEAINKLGSIYSILITYNYKELKMSELRLEYELQQKIYDEKEEQKEIRDQMREEERAIKEYEKAQKEAEDEENRYQKALDKARLELSKAKDGEIGNLNLKISDLEKLLEESKLQKERAMSMAQQTKCGHVYVISNVGAFGEDVYKIGMTRRLEPMDRVRELGDASVPFHFDVHAMIYSENAPSLENALHKKFEDRRLNLINNRREFFNVSIEEIENVTNDLGLEITLAKIVEAREFNESKSIRETRNHISVDNFVEKQLDRFPEMV